MLRRCRGRVKILPFALAVTVITAAFFGASAALSFIDRRLHPIRYSVYVGYYSGVYGVPEEIVYAVILTESRFQRDAVSRAGACGLMQLMPATYEAVAYELDRIPDEIMIFDPGTNICCGVYLLSKLYEKYGCWETAFAAYNAGEAAVDLWLSDDRYSASGRLTYIPYSETAGYVKKVRCAAESYKKIYGFGNGPGQNTGEGQ
ncbi:MAG: lytic transglycosylase domain-containing protein [Eubacteriales bacterium]|nr:lytic transglycosylase domain-containing protein [Candidatus Colimorpha enterica]